MVLSIVGNLLNRGGDDLLLVLGVRSDGFLVGFSVVMNLGGIWSRLVDFRLVWNLFCDFLVLICLSFLSFV